MGVEVIRKTPPKTTEPIKTVTLSGPGGRAIVVRPNSTDPEGKRGHRTVEVSGTYGVEWKWTAMLGDLRSFGQALIDIADGK